MSRCNIITLEDVHKLTDNGKLVFEKEVGNFSTNKNISSPLRAGDSNPSFRIYQSDSSIWSFKDYGGNGEAGSYITFIMTLYGLTFQQAIDKIWKDFNGNNTKFTKKIIEKPKEIKKEPLLFEFNDCRFNDNHKKYMDSYELDEEYLNSRDVWAVDKWAINKKIVPKTKGEFNFAYVPRNEKGEIINGKLKILSLGKSVEQKNKWKTNLNNSYIWWLNYVKNCKQLWIVKSNKDALCLNKHYGIDAVITQNESSKIYLDNNVSKIENICNNIIICYGTDEQGKTQSINITKERGYKWFNTPNLMYKMYSVEDVSDYIKYFGVNSLKTLLKQKGYL